MRASPHPIDVPLELQIALDLVAARLDCAEAVVLAPTEQIPTVELWIRPLPPGPASRIVWLATSDPLVASGLEGRGAAMGSPTADLVVDHLTTGGRLGVIAAGRLGALFDRLRGRPPVWAPTTAIEALLRAAGLRITTRAGIGGVSTLLWAAMARAAERGGRPELADRLAFRHRRSLAPRRDAGAAELTVLIAERV